MQCITLVLVKTAIVMFSIIVRRLYWCWQSACWFIGTQRKPRLSPPWTLNFSVINHHKTTEPLLQAPTLVLAECVLVYLDASEAAAIIAALGALLPNAVFAVYEQVTR